MPTKPVGIAPPVDALVVATVAASVAAVLGEPVFTAAKPFSLAMLCTAVNTLPKKDRASEGTLSRKLAGTVSPASTMEPMEDPAAWKEERAAESVWNLEARERMAGSVARAERYETTSATYSLVCLRLVSCQP
jgi:hypothetical protein